MCFVSHLELTKKKKTKTKIGKHIPITTRANKGENGFLLPTEYIHHNYVKMER